MTSRRMKAASGAAKTMALLTPASAMRSLSRFWLLNLGDLATEDQHHFCDEEDDAEQRRVHRHDDEGERVGDHRTGGAQQRHLLAE